MASNIKPYSIDGTFPIAGQDNSSQGFRDNFTNIKNNFVFAQNEINDLQSKVLVTAALSGQSINNDMAGTQIRRPQLASWTQTLYDNGNPGATAILDFNQANFQKITTGEPLTIDFANWPSSTGQGALGYGSMRVWIVVTNIVHTVTLPSSVSIGSTDLAGSTVNVDGSITITFDNTGNYLFDFSSIDGGEHYQVIDLSRNRVQFRDPTFYFNPEVNPTLLIGYEAASVQMAREFEQGQDTVSIYGSYNSLQVDDLSQNQVNTLLTSMKAPGYSVTSSRGNLDNAGLQGVSSGDFLGYYQALAQTAVDETLLNSYKGFQQMGAIGFYAMGANVTGNGMGGNIGFFTRRDDDADPVVYQALGIENDQSVTFFGQAINFKTNQTDASDNLVTLDTDEYVDFADFSGEIIVNDIDNGYVYKFLVGSGNVYMTGCTNGNWTPVLAAPNTTFTITSWIQIEFVGGVYRFTNLAGLRDFSFYTVKTRNGA